MMTSEHIKIRMGRIFSSYVSPLLIVCAILWGIFLVIERSDRKIMEQYQSSYRLAHRQDNDSTNRFSLDEERIANHFIADTLPGLMQKGLIKKYTREQSGTLLHVEGKIWKDRSEFFRQSLLMEIFVYNKVHGYAASTRVIDNQSEKLYASIEPPDRIKFYD